jgi:hypothetical protein
MQCSHEPRRVHGPWGEAVLSVNGSWWQAVRRDGGLEAVAVVACPGCGIKLWGLPPVAPKPQPEAQAHSMFRKVPNA